MLRADDVTYDSNSGEATASGHFTLDGGPNDDHIKASHGTYNLTAETGRFYDVTATTGMRFHASRAILTSTSPFAFTGTTGGENQFRPLRGLRRHHYHLRTAASQSGSSRRTKWWWMWAAMPASTTATFLLHGFPIFYFPYATHPVAREARHSGFLVPTAGRSSTKGNIVGDSFYWAINRSLDATIGAEYFSKRGWSQRGEFRARPSDTLLR